MSLQIQAFACSAFLLLVRRPNIPVPCCCSLHRAEHTTLYRRLIFCAVASGCIESSQRTAVPKVCEIVSNNLMCDARRDFNPEVCSRSISCVSQPAGIPCQPSFPNVGTSAELYCNGNRTPRTDRISTLQLHRVQMWHCTGLKATLVWIYDFCS